MTFIFEHERRGISYKGHYIQTYSFGSGENIIFSFPSFPHSGLYYVWFAQHYQKHNIKFITFDLPGWIGYSENFLHNEKFSIDEYVEIAKEILKDYKVKEFSVVGYSFGGMLGIKLASDWKDKVRNVVIVSTIINGNIVNSRTAFLIRLAKRLKAYSNLESIIKRKFKALSKILLSKDYPSNTLNLYQDMLSHIDGKVMLESAYQLFSSDWTHYLLDIKDKKIMVVNSKDETRMFRQQAEYIRRHLGGEKSFYLHGTHDDFILNPKKEVVEKVINFLDQ